MPRVLRIINRFNLGGPTYNAAYLSRYLSSDFETMLIGGIKEDSEESSEYIVRNLGLEPVLIPEMRRSLNPTNDFVAYRKISKIIKEFKPDIVHTHASKAGTVGRMAAARQNVPVVVHTFHGHVFHSYFNSAKTRVILNIEQGLAEQTSKIIAISEKQKEELSQTFKIAPPEKFEVIPLGFDLSRFRENNDEKRLAFRKKYNLGENELAIGIVGRLAPVKNHKLFIESFKNIKEKCNRPVRAFIIGDGELKQELVEFCRVMNLSLTIPVNGHVDRADVTFTSWIKDIDKAYPGLDVIAMTSLNEGTPVSLIEAQAANRPIVTTNVGGIENIVIPGKTALLTNNNDVNDFTEKLLSIVKNDELRKEQTKYGWEQVESKFHYTRLVSDMENLYYKLLSEVK